MQVTPISTPTPSRTRRRRSQSTTTPIRVLLGEDDDELRARVAWGLRVRGIEVTEARNGREMLDYLQWLFLAGYRQHSLDAIVTDIQMPGATGLDILSGLRRAEWTTPVILVTGFPDDDVEAEAKRLGALAVLPKPFDMAELRRLVCSAALV